MQKCERCQTNDARVRLDTVVNGRREQHYFCQPCAEELLAKRTEQPFRWQQRQPLWWDVWHTLGGLEWTEQRLGGCGLDELRALAGTAHRPAHR